MPDTTGKVFVGFGFGPIQSALFLYEAYKSGNFSRFVVADVDAELVSSIRENGGRYFVNIARLDGIVHESVEGVEIYNPDDENDRKQLIDSISVADEMCTALPSVNFYNRHGDDGKYSIADLIVMGLLARGESFPTIIYTAENNNRAAEILREELRKVYFSLGERVLENKEGTMNNFLEKVNILNTVIGKMSGVIRDPSVIEKLSLVKLTPQIERAVLVEEFNRILISKIFLENFRRGIEVFIEKKDLLPFEEAKLYGHNAIHAMIAYLGDVKGYETIGEAGRDRWIMEIAKKAFLEESGGALIKKYGYLGEPLFTEKGYREYAEDLLIRMVNPHLNDTIERVGRDRPRKLGIEDRLFGTMILALDHDIVPVNLSIGGAAGVVSMIKHGDMGTVDKLSLPSNYRDLVKNDFRDILMQIWGDNPCVSKYGEELIGLTYDGYLKLRDFL